MASVRMTAGFRVYRFIDAYGFSCLGFRALGVYLLKPSLGGGVVLGRIQVFRACSIVAPPQTQLPSRVQYRSLNNKNGVLGGGGVLGGILHYGDHKEHQNNIGNCLGPSRTLSSLGSRT